jgi:hypothetical protein
MKELGSLISFVALALGLAACGGPQVRSDADAAFARGDYLEAADGFAAEARLGLDDHRKAHMEEARTKAIEGLLDDIASDMRRKVPIRALERTHVVVSKMRSWGWTPPAPLRARVDAAVGSAANFISAQLQSAVAERRPLVARKTYAKYARYIEGEAFLSLHNQVEAMLHKAGDERCHAYAAMATKDTPYFSEVVSKYCGLFGVAYPTAALPDLASSLTVFGNVDGLDDEQSARAKQQLADAFRGSVFYRQNGPLVATAHLSGKQVVSFAAEVKQREKHYTEDVNLPPAVVSTPAPPAPVGGATVHSSVGGGSMVVGGGTVPVERTYSYTATEHVGSYSSDWLVHLVFGDRVAPFDVRAALSATAKGTYTEAESDVAGVSPQRPNLMSKETFYEAQLKNLDQRIKSGLRARWETLFCERTAFDLETASRCLHASPSPLPEPALHALESVMGVEAQELAVVLAP